MKRYILLLIAAFSLRAQAQTISIHVLGGQDSVIQVQYPINGINYNWWPNKKNYQLDAHHYTSFRNALGGAGMIHLIYGGKIYNIVTEPGKSLAFKLIVTGKEQTLEAQGANAAGIVLLNQLNRQFYQYKARDYLKKDSVMLNVKSAIEQDMKKELIRFDSLLAIKKISPVFYRYARRDIRYHYAAVLSFVICGEYARRRYDIKHPAYKATLNKDMEAAWPGVYTAYALNDTFAAGAPDFFDYAKDYISWYKEMYLSEKGGTGKAPLDKHNQFERYYKGFTDNFAGSTREYLQARYIFEEASQQEFQPELITLFNNFTRSYPSSKYTVFLTPLIADIKSYQAAQEQPLKPGQQLLESSKITSFDQLMAPFKGKIVYVDLWATWCAPCKEQFRYNAELKKFLTDNNVEMLYISMDKDDADVQWKEMIRYYDLKGSHVRTTDSLRKELLVKLWDGKSYWIPRYLIVKDGVIVQANAFQPSDKQKLYDQIKKGT